MTDDSPAVGATAEERISREIARIHEESYGIVPQAVQSHMAGDFVVVVLDVDLLEHERLIMQNGSDGGSIRAVRSDFQSAVASTFIAAVERSTGRRVTGFLSDTHVNPSFTVEVFRLAPHEA